MKKILVICTGNSCRSQMAHGYLEAILQEKAKIYSAGIEAHGLNPWAVRVMLQAGIDISNYTSNLIDEYKKMEFDYVITVCDHAKEKCPVFPSMSVQIHQNFPDPANAQGEPAELEKVYGDVRDMIAEFVEGFAKEHFQMAGSSVK